jgi:hypothetical protein
VHDALIDEGWGDRDASRSLTSAMIVWSIDAYYDGEKVIR